ncbi:MAG TPA: Gfo/Idh/MocA family oxidoreductase [Thermoanaerobaculia bacterium]|nr:Gfo/Idh/MocA family oxidoreductase [Thermoanaerobaculia bacterium]
MERPGGCPLSRPGKLLRISVLGAGHWGPNLIRNFHNHQTSEVAWVVDRDPARLALTRDRFPDVPTSDDSRAATIDPAVDAVVIATPTVTHYQLAAEALEAGKHVLVEKPIATRVAEAEELCRLAESRGLVLMVGQVFLFNAAIRRAREILDQGTLGRIFYLSMVRTNLGPIRMDVNAAWDLAAHDVAIANDWLQSAPSHVSAQGGSWINGGIEDAVFANLWYPGGVIAHLHVSWLSPRKVRDITVVGEKGMLTFDDMNLSEPLRFYDKQVTEQRSPGFIDSFASFRTSIRDGDILIPKVAANEPLKAECDHFLECIRTGARPRSDGWSGAAAVRVLSAFDRSMAEDGRRIAV